MKITTIYTDQSQEALDLFVMQTMARMAKNDYEDYLRSHPSDEGDYDAWVKSQNQDCLGDQNRFPNPVQDSWDFSSATVEEQDKFLEDLEMRCASYRNVIRRDQDGDLPF
jgi:hypothetical protein